MTTSIKIPTQQTVSTLHRDDGVIACSPTQESQPRSGRGISQLPVLELWGMSRRCKCDLRMVRHWVFSAHTCTPSPYTHTCSVALEHAAKCALMRNSWSGSAQIKDIPVRELPPVFPSCRAASKWVLLSLTPAGAARAQQSHSTWQLFFLDWRQPRPGTLCHHQGPGHTGDYRCQGTPLHCCFRHFSNWEHLCGT